MRNGGHEEIPVNLELLSDDNRVGVLLVLGGGLCGGAVGDWLGWSMVFSGLGVLAVVMQPLALVIGSVLVVRAGRRLLTPGCRPLLRINFGGVTDVRLLSAPIRWSGIVDARRPAGVVRYLLPGVVLQLHEEYETMGVETMWSRLIHLPCRLRGKHILFLECGTLDHTTDQALEAIRSHLRARVKTAARR
ncbi:MAG: hypothetical protein G8237_05945 [Magnetococcales bacterium]|nr:hypothetical protein [Magnetococcales bacterium]NGZ05881.1 hypothetical protein [Magnetococcales bacterium]